MAMTRILPVRLGGLLIAASLSTGCGGHKVLDDPSHIPAGEPVAVASNDKLTVVVDWVIVRDGAGSWAANADWDQYLVRLGNTSDETLRITDLTLYDSFDEPLASSGDRKELIAGSKATARRYKDAGLNVKAGIGGPALVLAGTAAYATGATLGAAALYSSAAAGAALGALVLAPALAVGGVVRGMRNSEVAREIAARQIPMPAVLEPDTVIAVSAFFPLAPSPRRLVLTYADSDAEYELVVDISAALEGLHLSSVDAGDSTPRLQN